MANAWKKDKTPSLPCTPKLILTIPILLLIALLILRTQTPILTTTTFSKTLTSIPPHSIPPFDCFKCPQSSPIFASTVEGLRYPFIFSLSDIGSLPEKPHKNIVRMLKGKPFRKPDISETIQGILEKMKGRTGVVVDVGANVGMATFAATAMGFRVLAFEPVFENLQRICDGVFFNRVGSAVTLYNAAASDQRGNITFHKLVGRLDNSAVSASGAKLTFKSNEEIALQVISIPLDDVIPESEQVLLIKIDVQGWEYHVLRGASKLLSRKRGEAPYLIYEEDERLLSASNSSAKEIRGFLAKMGYHQCTRHGNDAHCNKE